jgi:hypothetical protein
MIFSAHRLPNGDLADIEPYKQHGHQLARNDGRAHRAEEEGLCQHEMMFAEFETIHTTN